MATYTQCPDSMATLVRKVQRQYHPHLSQAGVTFNLLYARSTGDAAAVSVNGYPALAMVKINSLKDRVSGLADARIVFDELAWIECSDQRKIAIIDHESMHLELMIDQFGKVKEDDCGRPRLKIRLHDFQGGGFAEIVRRHQLEAVEAEFIEKVHESFRQGLLNFAS